MTCKHKPPTLQLSNTLWLAVAAGGLPAGRSSELVVMFNESLRDLNRLLMCCLSFARAHVAPARLRAPPEHSVRLLVAPVFSRVTVFTRFVYTVAPPVIKFWIFCSCWSISTCSNFDREFGGRQIFVTRVSHEIDVLLCTWYLSVLNDRLLTCQLSDTHHINYLVALPNTLRVCSTLILVYQSPPVDMQNLLFHITLTSICSDKSFATSLFPILRTT